MKLFLGCEDTKTPLHTGKNRVLSEVLLAPEGGNEGSETLLRVYLWHQSTMRFHEKEKIQQGFIIDNSDRVKQ